MNALDGIRRGRKFDQVLEGAREVFLNDGFEGASVDDIAKAACVSKATLYSYFPDKRLLFTEVAKCECRRQAEEAVTRIDMSRPPRDVLAEAGRHMIRFYLSDFGQRVFRICVAESDRFPDLGESFYDSGPRLVEKRLTDYFQLAMSRGELAIDDLPLAAHQFAELCKVELFPRIVFGVQATFTTDEIERVLTGAVDMFLARYGA
ncbi:DNA-binding transcriptional regulator, AcrR family [Tranquillimonas rosea]|uniref:DNA-binding transcriptional regulator, AcrR family n=1 Tax=Tranquillimonas rosea TaxID=641238 RepID=A0A1H9U637_9RHOB|nr:TetR/AcrR family transcriptional regulator [Tranquillimonas rosea]SES04906.1 DNA-binding transcriptional regulator, AcrR family [Tranquillimonas rosea]